MQIEGSHLHKQIPLVNVYLIIPYIHQETLVIRWLP